MPRKVNKVAVVTGTRAEYGLLRWLLHELRERLELQLVVTGTHLSHEFGYTVREIEEDGFAINERVDMLLSSDDAAGVTKSAGLAMIGFADAFQRLRPDMVVLLGDRFEIFAAAGAATIAHIPIAHIHGGELTEGAIDDAFRHSITKMSHLHFTATENYQKRVIQLGESPDRVFTVGAMVNDNLQRLPKLSRQALQQELGFDLGESCAVVTFHPVTRQPGDSERQMNALLQVLQRHGGLRLIFTYPNADAEGRGLIPLIDEFVSRNADRAIARSSLGARRYLSALKHVDLVIGNSSSGILEAPFFGTPTVNIGSRQSGRVRGASVIDCEPTIDSISAAIDTALSGSFGQGLKECDNPYAGDHPATTVAEKICAADLAEISSKTFYNIDDSK